MDVNGDGHIDQSELEEVRKFLFITTNEQRMNKLAIDRNIDVNNSGWIEQNEFDSVHGPLMRELVRAWLYDSHQNADRWVVTTRLDQLADLNSDGFIDASERRQTAEALWKEHGVNSRFDQLIDTDSNGFIDKYEIEEAQLAGIDLSIDSAVGKMVPSGSGRTLAIVKSTSPDKKLEESVGEVIISFIQNAFITSGNYRIVDRRNLDAVMDEQKLSLSGMVRESDAVQLGQLIGAELVGVAELYKLDNIYYLNLKLLEALSGELVNSSIAEAGSIQEFFAMCTDAVKNLQ